MALISLTKLVDVNLLRYSDFLDPTPGVWMEPQTSHKPTHFNTSPSPTCDKVKDASVCSRPTWRTVCLFNQPAPTSSWFFLGGSTDQFFTWSTWLCCLFACCHLKLPWTWAAFYLASTTVLETPGPKCWLFQSHPIFSWAPPPKTVINYSSLWFPPVHLIQFLSWRKIFTSWGQNGDVTSTEIASTRHLPCQRQPRSHKKKRDIHTCFIAYRITCLLYIQKSPQWNSYHWSCGIVVQMWKTPAPSPWPCCCMTRLQQRSNTRAILVQKSQSKRS